LDPMARPSKTRQKKTLEHAQRRQAPGTDLGEKISISTLRPRLNRGHFLSTQKSTIGEWMLSERRPRPKRKEAPAHPPAGALGDLKWGLLRELAHRGHQFNRARFMPPCVLAPAFYQPGGYRCGQQPVAMCVRGLSRPISFSGLCNR